MVNPDRRMRLWALVVQQSHGATVAVDHVGAAAIRAVDIDAAAVTLILAASPWEGVYASGQLATDMEELTMTLGEGPGIDAASGVLALASDLNEEWCQTRWPIFAAAAVHNGVRAVFALPLQVGGIRLGVMDLYRARAGPLWPDQLADALLLADTACALILDASAVVEGRRPEGAGLHHPEVHQATGMIIAQAGVTAAEALVRLRAFAYAHDRRLHDVAADVVARRLRFPADIGSGSDGE